MCSFSAEQKERLFNRKNTDDDIQPLLDTIKSFDDRTDAIEGRIKSQLERIMQDDDSRGRLMQALTLALGSYDTAHVFGDFVPIPESMAQESSLISS